MSEQAAAEVGPAVGVPRRRGSYSLAELIVALTAFAAAFSVLQAATLDRNAKDAVNVATLLGVFNGAMIGGASAWAHGQSRRGVLLAIVVGLVAGGIGGAMIAVRVSLLRVGVAATLVCGMALALRLVAAWTQ